MICQGNTILRNPTTRQIADCLGFNESIDQTHVRELIIGAGLSGLAAAIYGASEGLMFLCWKLAGQVVRQALHLELKITWDLT